ncbi:hypothetical protein BJ138DRAFT_1159048 [Hygrophoropsis aurantiaca]|uniref:Uncharacterized protein n=1 Tax=Hygrophoropsis aurantiaca TaxID=72124 RepID=A0ACB8A3R3_9AGAM|nr:hypothetical protein BJ138DRAFT_1159048 [Hygrophoropsis aurantiaca]
MVFVLFTTLFLGTDIQLRMCNKNIGWMRDGPLRYKSPERLRPRDTDGPTTDRQYKNDDNDDADIASRAVP